MTNRLHSAEIEQRLALLSERFASRIAGALGAQSAALSHDIVERLRASREQALAQARRQTVAGTAPALAGRTSGGAAMLGAPSPWWLKLASGLPVLVLLAGLIAIDRWTAFEDVQAAAEIDAMLLADELPPNAYADPGFAEYLRSPLP